jgi:hypothetical protein
VRAAGPGRDRVNDAFYRSQIFALKAQEKKPGCQLRRKKHRLLTAKIQAIRCKKLWKPWVETMGKPWETMGTVLVVHEGKAWCQAPNLLT